MKAKIPEANKAFLQRQMCSSHTMAMTKKCTWQSGAKRFPAGSSVNLP